MVNRDGPAHLLLNVVPDRGNWIAFQVIDEHGRNALGATITLRARDRTVHHEVRSASSYCSANDPRVHIGLGEADHVTDVTVRWPDGTRQMFGSFDAGGTVTLRRGSYTNP